ncbi:MAG: hypothetical protein WCV50_06535 [Patescibacteria group bacterium]
MDIRPNDDQNPAADDMTAEQASCEHEGINHCGKCGFHMSDKVLPGRQHEATGHPIMKAQGKKFCTICGKPLN